MYQHVSTASRSTRRRSSRRARTRRAARTRSPRRSTPTSRASTSRSRSSTSRRRSSSTTSCGARTTTSAASTATPASRRRPPTEFTKALAGAPARAGAVGRARRALSPVGLHRAGDPGRDAGRAPGRARHRTRASDIWYVARHGLRRQARSTTRRSRRSPRRSSASATTTRRSSSAARRTSARATTRNAKRDLEEFSKTGGASVEFAKQQAAKMLMDIAAKSATPAPRRPRSRHPRMCVKKGGKGKRRRADPKGLCSTRTAVDDSCAPDALTEITARDAAHTCAISRDISTWRVRAWFFSGLREDRPQMDTRTLLRERLRRSRDWVAAIDELEKELEASGTKPEQSRAAVRARRSRRGCDSRARTRARAVPARLEAASRTTSRRCRARARSTARSVASRWSPSSARWSSAARLAPHEPRADRRRGAARQRAEGQGARRSSSARSSSTPDSVRVKDALARAQLRPRVLDRRRRRLLRRRPTSSTTSTRGPHAAARGAHPADRGAGGPAARGAAQARSSRRTSTSRSRTSCTRRCSPATNRWDELEAHHRSRAERAPDHGKKVEALRMFALEWVQRFKDRDRGAKFFDAAIKATASNGAGRCGRSSRRSRCSARCRATRGEWSAAARPRRRVIDRARRARRSCTSRSRPARSRSTRPTTSRARRKYFAVAARDRAAEPERPGLRRGGRPRRADAPARCRRSPTQPATARRRSRRAACDADEGRSGRRRGRAEAHAARRRCREAEVEPRRRRPRPSGRRPPSRAPPKAAAARRKRGSAAREGAQPRAKSRRRSRARRCQRAISASAMKAARRHRGRRRPGRPRVEGRHREAPDRSSAPRRELARVLRAASSWAQLADALKDEEAKASRGRRREGRGVPRARRDVRQAQQRQPGHLGAHAARSSRIRRGSTIYDRLGALYEAKKRWPDLVKVLTEKAERTEGDAREGRDLSCRSRTSTSSGSRTRPRRSRRSRACSSSIRTTSRRSITCSRSTRSAATGRS